MEQQDIQAKVTQAAKERALILLAQVGMQMETARQIYEAMGWTEIAQYIGELVKRHAMTIADLEAEAKAIGVDVDTTQRTVETPGEISGQIEVLLKKQVAP